MYEGTFQDGLTETDERRVFLSSLDEEYWAAWDKFHASTTSLSSIERVGEEAYQWNDPVHGEVLIDDPVIGGLIETPAFKRLWGVQQFGERWAVSSLLRSRPHSRAEHSLGTYQLVRRGAPGDRELHVAALLHDVGHTAFSHHGEAAFDDTTAQNWHEKHLERIVDEPQYGVAEVLERYDINPGVVLSRIDHPLLDQPMPELCADRIDYILRDLTAAYPAYETICPEVIEQIIIKPDGSGWYVERPETAQFLKRGLEVCNLTFYTNPMMRQIKQHTSGLFKHALAEGYLTETDIGDGRDDEILETLWNRDEVDVTLDSLLLRLKEFGVARSTPESMGYIVDYYQEFQTFDPTTKQRSINPYCRTPHGLVPVSEIYPHGEPAYYEINEGRLVVLPGLPYP